MSSSKSGSATVDCERFEGPAEGPVYAEERLACAVDTRGGRGDGTLSKSTSEVRGTGRLEDPARETLGGKAG